MVLIFKILLIILVSAPVIGLGAFLWYQTASYVGRINKREKARKELVRAAAAGQDADVAAAQEHMMDPQLRKEIARENVAARKKQQKTARRKNSKNKSNARTNGTGEAGTSSKKTKNRGTGSSSKKMKNK